MMNKKLFGMIICLVIFSTACTLFKFKGESIIAYYPDAEGWNRIVLKGDIFQSNFLLNTKEGLYLVSPNEDGSGDIEKSETLESAYIEGRNNTKINLGTNENPIVFDILMARRALYANHKIKDMPIFKMWLEQTFPNEFLNYKQGILNQLNELGDSVFLEKFEYKNHEYYIYLRKDLSFEGLKGDNSIGGMYIFFPELNLSEFLFFFNTKYNDKNAYLISKEEIQNLAQELIDSVVKN